MAYRTLFASSRPTVAVASVVAGLTVALSALALTTRHVRLASAYNTARPVIDSASRLQRFLDCVRPASGLPEADRPYWCAATGRCVLGGDAGLDGCPESSPRCRLPLISPGDRLFDPVGITNQKMNVRDAAAIARAIGGALLVTQVAMRAEALWDPGPLRGLNVSWTHVAFGAAFDAAHFLRAAGATVCAFYEPDDSTLEVSGPTWTRPRGPGPMLPSRLPPHRLAALPLLVQGIATELVRVDSPPSRHAAWFRAEAEGWRRCEGHAVPLCSLRTPLPAPSSLATLPGLCRRGAALVVLKNPWAAFRPPPVPGAVDSLANPRPHGSVVAWTSAGPTPDVTPADPDDDAFARIYADWPLWFVPPPEVRRVVAAALASLSLGGAGVAQRRKQRPFWALHLRAEKDWPYHVPEPAIILQEVGGRGGGGGGAGGQ